MAGTKSTTERTGIKKLTVPWWAGTLEEADVCGDPSLIGLPLTTREVAEREPAGAIGGYTVTLSYEGLNSDAPGAETMEWEGSFREVPIEQLPDILELVELLGGEFRDDGTVSFPPELPQAKGRSGSPYTLEDLRSGRRVGSAAETRSRRLGLALGTNGKNESAKRQKNPLYGLPSYPLFGAEFRRTYALKSLNSGLIVNIGKVIKRLPGKYSALNVEGTDWLVLSPVIRERGNAYEVTERLMMSPPGGHNPFIHALVQGTLARDLLEK